MKKLLFIANICAFATAFSAEGQNPLPGSTILEHPTFHVTDIMKSLEDNPENRGGIFQNSPIKERFIIVEYCKKEDPNKERKVKRSLMIDFDKKGKPTKCVHREGSLKKYSYFYPREVCPSCKENAQRAKNFVLETKDLFRPKEEYYLFLKA